MKLEAANFNLKSAISRSEALRGQLRGSLRDRTVKKSRYIPKRLVPKVERMNDEKVSVRRILEVLGVKD